jgi:hypothetical protein
MKYRAWEQGTGPLDPTRSCAARQIGEHRDRLRRAVSAGAHAVSCTPRARHDASNLGSMLVARENEVSIGREWVSIGPRENLKGLSMR